MVFIESALLLFSLVNVTNAAREGARAGAVYQYPFPIVPCQSSPCTQEQVLDQVIAIDNDRLSNPAYGITPTIAICLEYPNNINQCKVDVVYMPDPPMRETDGTSVWDIYRQFYSMSVRVSCRNQILFGLAGEQYITVSSESTMKIEPGGISQDNHIDSPIWYCIPPYTYTP